MTVTRKTKKIRKKYPRPTTARFDTAECKILLDALTFSAEKEHFWEKGEEHRRMVYKIKDRLKERIKKGEERNENGGGDQEGAIHPAQLPGDNRSSPSES